MEIKHPLLDKLLPGLEESEPTSDTIDCVRKLASTISSAWIENNVSLDTETDVTILGKAVRIDPDELDWMDMAFSLEDLKEQVTESDDAEMDESISDIHAALTEIFQLLNVVGVEAHEITVNAVAYFLLAVLLNSTQEPVHKDLEF